MSFRLGVERNTYTIIGRCKRTGQLGVAIATHSLAVGGYCPGVQTGVGAVSSQAYADPRLMSATMEMLQAGKGAEEVISQLGQMDEFFEYRQIGIVDHKGDAALHTGENTTSWAGGVAGDNYVAMGNCLANENVVIAMGRAFNYSVNKDLSERLVTAIEAGRAAGGQFKPYMERSAALIVHGKEDYPMIDLRVDVHTDAITELRRAYEVYKPYVPLYYDLRPKRPDMTPPQDQWIQENTPPQRRKITIVALGDSITEAVEVAPELRWSAILERALTREYPDLEITVVNSGVGGNTSFEGLMRFEKDVLRHKPDIVLAEFGNDIVDDVEREVTLAGYLRNFRSIKARLDEIDARFVVMPFTPVVDEWHCDLSKEKFVKAGGHDRLMGQYREALRRYAETNQDVGIIDTDKALRTEMGENPESIIQPDGVHLTAQGNQVFADTVFEGVRLLIGEMLQ